MAGNWPKSRISSLVVMVPALLVVVGAVWTEPRQARVYRVGVLSAQSDLEQPIIKGLRKGLKAGGYAEGDNLILEVPLNKTFEELRIFAKIYSEKNFDALVTVGDVETAIARGAAGDIPIIFMPAGDPLQSGFVKSLSRPETRLTGLTYDPTVEMRGKNVEVFKEVVPTLRRIVALHDQREVNRIRAMQLAVVRHVAKRLGLVVAQVGVKTVREAEQVVSSLSRDAADGIFTVCTSLFRDLKQLSVISVGKKIPLYGCSTRQVADGALTSYAPDLYGLGYRGAWYVDRILKGTKPEEMPVETPAKYELAINLKVANQIGLRIPPEVLILADKVVP